MTSADDDLEILDVAPRPTTSEVAVSTDSGRRNTVLVGLGVVLALVVAVSLASSPGKDESQTDTTVAQDDDDDDLTDESVESTLTDESDAEDDVVDDDVSSDVIGVGDALAPVEPFLTNSGLTLYGQLADGTQSGMVGINLDTGDVTNFGYPYDEILLQSDAYLIVRNSGGERHSAVSLVAPETAPRVVSQNTWVVAAREEGGEHVVAFLTQVETDESLRYTEMTIDLDLGTIIYRGTLRDSHPFVARNALSTDTTLFTGPTGGVYEARGPNFEQVAEGRILGFDDNFAIVERCDDSLDCAVEWLQRSDWSAVDRPLPDLDFEHVEVLGGGRILVFGSQFGGELNVFDVDAGALLETPTTGNVGDVAVSPDGSTVAIAAGGVVVLIDVESGLQIGSSLPDLEGPLTVAITP